MMEALNTARCVLLPPDAAQYRCHSISAQPNTTAIALPQCSPLRCSRLRICGAQRITVVRGACARARCAAAARWCLAARFIAHGEPFHSLCVLTRALAAPLQQERRGGWRELGHAAAAQRAVASCKHELREPRRRTHAQCAVAE